MQKDTLWTASDLTKALGQTVTGAWQAGALSSDTRRLKAGDIFIALKGAKQDGHDHVAAALSAGASLALVERPVEGVTSEKLVLVPHVLDALSKLGHFARQRSSAKVIGITGSLGKTSTKEMISLMLSVQGSVTATERSLNNHWGVPLTLAGIGKKDQYAVIEMGMNHTGELSQLTKLVEPDVALITNVAPAHLVHFKDVDAIAHAKSEILEGVRAGGTAVLNKDNNWFRIVHDKAVACGIKNILTFGSQADCTAQLVSIDTNETGTRIKANIDGKSYDIQMAVYGQHWALNTLGALLAVKAVGADLDKGIAALKNMQPVQGRGQQHLKKMRDGDIRIIDESHNANPTSMMAAFDVLGVMPATRRIAVLGDMLELGTDEQKMHEGLLDSLKKNKVDMVFTSGARMKWLYDVLPAVMKAAHNDDPVLLARDVVAAVKAGDAITIKGSRGQYADRGRMYAIVDALLKALSSC